MDDPPELLVACSCSPEVPPDHVRPVEGEAADAELAELAKALGHPTRVRILRLLAGRGQCICGDIVREIPAAQSTVSEHLRILKAAGLIRGEIDGPRVCYCLSPRAVRRLEALVGALWIGGQP
jgi:ArsR family transcriptional regulator